MEEVSPLTHFTCIKGIETFQGLEQKLRISYGHHQSQQMKERCESELKREIKKLQKIREFMRGINSNPDVKDKSKAEDARKRIEVVS